MNLSILSHPILSHPIPSYPNPNLFYPFLSYLCIYLSIHPSNYLSTIYLSVCLSVYLSLPLCVCVTRIDSESGSEVKDVIEVIDSCWELRTGKIWGALPPRKDTNIEPQGQQITRRKNKKQGLPKIVKRKIISGWTKKKKENMSTRGKD